MENGDGSYTSGGIIESTGTSPHMKDYQNSSTTYALANRAVSYSNYYHSGVYSNGKYGVVNSVSSSSAKVSQTTINNESYYIYGPLSVDYILGYYNSSYAFSGISGCTYNGNLVYGFRINGQNYKINAAGDYSGDGSYFYTSSSWKYESYLQENCPNPNQSFYIILGKKSDVDGNLTNGGATINLEFKFMVAEGRYAKYYNNHGDQHMASIDARRCLFKQNVTFDVKVEAQDGEYSIDLTKVAYHDSSTKLSDAKFKITVSDGSNTYQYTKTTGSNGKISFTKSDSSLLKFTESSKGKTITITIEETKAPTGYSLPTGKITIKRNSRDK